jgi:hypothetical protein
MSVARGKPPPTELLLFAVVFFGVMVAANLVQAHRKKERTYYLGAVVGFLMSLAGISIILGQILLGLILFVSMAVLSVVSLPKMIRMREREALTLLREVELSAPIGWREFLTSKGWLKLASRWGAWKTVCFYSLLTTAITGGILFVFGMSVTYVVTYTITSAIIYAYMFYRQIRVSDAYPSRKKESQVEMKND